MHEYIDRNKFMQNLETDKYGFTDCVKVGVALDKATVDVAETIKEYQYKLKSIPRRYVTKKEIDQITKEMGCGE